VPAVIAAPSRSVAGVAEHRGRVMGTDLHVVAVGIPDATAGALVRAAARLDLLEARWSRFRPTSDPSRAASAAGAWVPVSPDTVRLVEAARTAHTMTGGRCDATGGTAIAAAGYDRDLDVLRAAGPAPTRPTGPFPGFGSVELDTDGCRLRLASGCVLDAGAVGKGLAADLVVAELLDGPGAIAGLEGLLVNIGGDLAARGRGPGPDGVWGVDVDLGADLDGVTDRPGVVRWSLVSGAVATSSTRRRTWRTSSGTAHHVLDPCTGAPAVGAPALVTVQAGAAWWAEAATTALILLAPLEREAWVRAADVAAVVVERDGTVVPLGDLEGRLA
jgi:thiamine biosynthesis lipoprotein